MFLGQLETMALRLIHEKKPMAGGTILFWFKKKREPQFMAN
jgi:hypothetical protein